MRDIRRILNEAGIQGAEFLAPLKMASGQVASVYNLPRRFWELVGGCHWSGFVIGCYRPESAEP